ncbi:MAG: LamG domain-containing protein, partial [Planctomycetota bacterium]
MEKARTSLLFVVVLHICFASGSVLGDAPTEGLIAHWKLDEGDGNTAYDSAGENDGNLYGDTSWVMGRGGSYALEFDGDRDYVDCGDMNQGGSTEYSITGWIKVDLNLYKDREFLFGIQDSTETWRYTFACAMYEDQVDANFLQCFAIEGGGGPDWLWQTAVPKSNIPDNEWFHLAASWKSSTDSNDLKVYINGEIPGNVSYLNDTSGSLRYGGMFSIGGDEGAPERDLRGSIDDVRVYDRALSAEEVGEIYLEGAGPIAHWKLDEGAGITAHDSVGDNNGVVYGAQWTDGIIDGALDFNGVGDYVDLGNDSNLKPALPITLCAWIRLSSSGADQHIIAIDNQTSAYYGVWLYVSDENDLVISYGDGGSPDQVNRRSKVGTTALDTDTWYHVAAVITGATDMGLYVNAVDDGGIYAGTGGNLVYSSASSLIGIRHDLALPFDGKIDDVRIYDRALSAEEVGEIYLEGSGPIAHWKLDEGDGNTAYDSVGDNNGVVYGAQWTDGIIDGALDFNGMSDYVDLGNDSNLKPPLPVTLSAWIRFSQNNATIVSLDDLSSIYYGVWL